MVRFAFFGTPAFAVPSLRRLKEFCDAQGHQLTLVVCQPDAKQGRGQKEHASPVKLSAVNLGIPIAQPATLKKNTTDGDAFFSLFQSLRIDLAVVVAYGKIIPLRFLQNPPYGFINVHGSILPRWRGAAPIQRAIEAGDTATGISIMQLVLELDAGAVYSEWPMAIEANDDTESLTPKLAELGAEGLVETLPGILDGSRVALPQAEKGVTYAHRLSKEEGRINWDKPARDVLNHVRAMQPWPGAYSESNGELLKLFKPSLADCDVDSNSEPGTVIRWDELLVVRCQTGCVAFAEAQLPGKKRTPIRELSKGRQISIGTVS